MQPAGCRPPAPSNLPALRTLDSLSSAQVFDALQGLVRLYCPLSFHLDPRASKTLDDPLVDSGYASGADDDHDHDQDALATLRSDAFERSIAERWLTGFIARAEALPCLADDDHARERAVEEASCVLESFFANASEDEQAQEELADFTRDFSFQVSAPEGQQSPEISVRLNDGLAGRNSDQPDDVGLQSWGASIVFSQLLCAEPGRFGLSAEEALGSPPAPRIVDLGAGTGLVSLVLAQLLPLLGLADATVIATDYHPAVLDNLRANMAANLSAADSDRIAAALLDWSAPSREPPLDKPADVLLATDVVYAPEHAVWLRDCATGFLAPGGVFWLVATVRETGRFDGVSNTVAAAFAAEDRPVGEDGRRLTILHEERLEKRKGIGRGDESAYKLFRIGWA
ncbi:hypothetical protein ACO1O0_005591 [Amphichorda felina]